MHEYLDWCVEHDTPITFTGMALYLGFADRTSFYMYQKAPQFTRVVTWARSIIELEYEKKLSGQNVTGSIFALKNHGWSDRQQFEHMGEDGGPVEIVVTRRIVRPDES